MLLATEQKNVSVVQIKVHSDVASYLNNQKRRELAELEGRGRMEIRINGSEAVFPEFLEIECLDSNERTVNLPTQKSGGRRSR